MDSRFCADGDPPGLCPCCRRPAGYVGYRPKGGMPFIWFCDDLRCQELAGKVYAMTDDDYRGLLDQARWEGGKMGGAYLDKIGKTDFAALSKEEYFNFLATVHHATENKLRELIENYTAVTGSGENG